MQNVEERSSDRFFCVRNYAFFQFLEFVHFYVGQLLIFHQDNHFFAEFRWQRKSHTLKTHTKQNHRIIFNLTFYTMSQFPITLHTSFCVELNCTCFLYLERVWLLNLKPFIPGILVVSGGIKQVRGKKGDGGLRPFRTWSFSHCSSPEVSQCQT